MSPRARPLIALWLGVASGFGCDASWLDAPHGDVDRGNEALAAQDARSALMLYDEAAAAIPESRGLHYDRGLALGALRRHDEATQTLLRALDAREPDLRFRVYAALGAVYARWALEIERSQPVSTPPAAQLDVDAPPVAEGPDPMEVALPRWERAVDHLEKALALRPDDEAALRNLEVALLRVDPPCRARDLEFEPNNSAGEASLMVLGEPEAPAMSGAPLAPATPSEDLLTWKRQLIACPDDTDWFRVELEEGDRLSAKLNAPADKGRLALSFLEPDGDRTLRPPPRSDRVLSSLEFTVGAGGQGAYLLRVENLGGEEVSYGLEVELRPACDRTDDHLEENDVPEQATDLTPGPIQGLKICPEDPDWFAVVLAEGESLFVFASPRREEDAPEDAPSPTLELAILGPGAAVVARGAPMDTGRVSTLLDPGEGRYLIRVLGGPELEARYDLIVRVVPPCPEGDDGHEDNDIVEDAVDLLAAAQQQPGPPSAGAPQGGPPPPILLRVCPNDVDWFLLEGNPEAPTVVSAIFDHAKGDLSLALFDRRGVEKIAQSEPSSPVQNGESLPLPAVEEATTFGLRIRGVGSAENFYLLKLDQPQGDGGQEKSDGDGDSKPPDEDQQEPESEEEKESGQAEAPQTPLEDRLDNLDHNPENLEARQRARTSPRSAPEKDW